MRYLPIGKELFTENRTRFTRKLKPSSVAVFNSNDIYPTNADGSMPFRQNNDLFYLSGIDQEETILVLFPDSPDPKYREMLFIKETNEHIAVWEGQKFNKNEAREISGISSVFWTSDFESILTAIIFEAQNIYLNTNEHVRSGNKVETSDERFFRWMKQKYPLHNYERAAPVMHLLRSIKSQAEINQLQTACDITEKTFRRLLKFVKPGVTEYEIEAEMWHEFVKNRSRRPAYEPIIASGANSCVLHYVNNDQVCKDGDLLLLDIGAEYANYNADLTRTIPVNGKYTPRQKAVYNAVLKAFYAARAMMVPGNTFALLNKEIGNLIESELKTLKLITDTDIKNQNPQVPVYKKYFMHGVGHFLGLDVHDVGNRYQPFEAGMVITCEPGIYIREEGLGIRIENDILVTNNGPVDLMAGIPIEADEIEEIMNG
jgi:Xaa-Pro aminopeptidase